MFAPKGDQPLWRLIYDVLLTLNVDDTITYAQLDEALGEDFRSNRSPFYTAQKRLERERHRTLANVPGVGYRVVAAQEHEGLAKHHHKKSKRQLGKSLAKIRSADREQLTDEQRARFDAIEMTLGRHADAIRSMGERQSRIEKSLQEARRAQKTDAAQANERLDRLVEALARRGLLDEPAVPDVAV